MTNYQCLRIQQPKFPKQSEHRATLQHGSGVSRFAVSRQSPLVTDADGMGVMVLAMRTHLCHRSPVMYLTVASNVKVIADVLKTPVMNMVISTRFKVKVPPLTGGGTMNDN